MIDSLSKDSARRALQLIERISRLMRSGDHAGGLNPAQWEALRYLARANRFSRSPAALADYLGSTRGTVSQTLMALEAKGLIEKEPDPQDGRAVRLSLTADGAGHLEQDASLALAAAIGPSGDADMLTAQLEALLKQALDARGGRAFGVCRTCQHFRADVRAGGPPHLCALLGADLTEADALQICIEQEPAPAAG
jgi:DNA-binding MarR family transcriptional regulator